MAIVFLVVQITSGGAQSNVRVRLSAGPAGQALSREIGLGSPLRQGRSESLSDDRGTANGWFHMTSGLMGRADPNHCQAAFLMQQDHAALLLRLCQEKQSTPEINIEDEAQARQFMAAACHRRQAALTSLKLPSADPISI